MLTGGPTPVTFFGCHDNAIDWLLTFFCKFLGWYNGDDVIGDWFEDNIDKHDDNTYNININYQSSIRFEY